MSEVVYSLIQEADVDYRQYRGPGEKETEHKKKEIRKMKTGIINIH